MIEEIDETLRELVRREALNGAQVEIAFDAKETTGGKTPDANGFVRWAVRLKPFARETLRLGYAVKRRKDVVGAGAGA